MKKEGQKKRISLNRNIVIIVAIVLLICYVSKFPWVFSKKYKHHDLDHAEIKLSEEIVTYSGMEVAPEIQVIVDDEVLKEGEDYEVQYFQNVMPGTAFAMISGIGAYDGNSFASFRILINDEICDDPENEAVVRFVCAWYENMFDNRRATRREIIHFVNEIRNDTLFDWDILYNMLFTLKLDLHTCSNEELVKRTYRAFYCEEADPVSINYWVGMIERGEISRYRFLLCIIESDKFMDIARRYSIVEEEEEGEEETLESGTEADETEQ